MKSKLSTFKKTGYVNIPTIIDDRGALSVFQNSINFKIKRIFYIYNFKKIRGGHSHKKNKQLLICLKGKVKIRIYKKKKISEFILNKKKVGLFLHPEDWHDILPLSKKPILLSLCSEKYLKGDYVYEK